LYHRNGGKTASHARGLAMRLCDGGPRKSDIRKDLAIVRTPPAPSFANAAPA
jgi:hypothetical protein